MATEQGAIPVIDFNAWSDGSIDDKKRIARELTGACRRVGFVYIINHAVPEDLLEEAFGWSKKLFDLPKEKKMLAPHPPVCDQGPTVHRGYSWPGLEKVSQDIISDGEEAKEAANRKIADVKESYEIGSEDNEVQPNIWLPEDILPGYREFMTQFYWKCFEAAKELLRALAIGVGLEDEDFFLRFHSGKNSQLRLLHYPPVEAEKLFSNTVARMPAHSDWGTITMLFQDDCGGLQVEHPNEPGSFVDATPMKNAMVMNVGDLLMRWSNDFLKSTLHRVTLPPIHSKTRIDGKLMTQPRYSIPYFVSPDPKAVIECLSVCTDEEHPVKYEPVVQEDYRRMRGRGQYAEAPAAPITVS
ncbi:Clavaminate synthase-like protein [Hypoxylon trugodes]|uniref:Clavaminate synthase-like protein n=1 Tax=Hypoxylon trugodes TaxID=326681 RepID=UPI00219E2C38|nr:Clavaminate synthase-like protein [Hypoxylon trugodes]KAI1390050.1 Clavaminate synthase-like protein [Hypoxylon trugodes]